MSDNALDKLFAEMRETERAFQQAQDKARDLKEAQVENGQKMNELGERRALLQRTLHKHIHEGLPIVQAKMVAHEEPVSTDTAYTMTVESALLRASAASIAAQSRWIANMGNRIRSELDG